MRADPFPVVLSMAVNDDVRAILAQVLGLPGGAASLASDTPLLGALPEFDSMAVVSVLTALEDHFGISVDDDEVEAALFETVATLSDFVAAKVAG